MMTDNSRQSSYQSPHPSLVQDDQWLEALLRKDSSDALYVEDGGFTASVVKRLPARVARSPRRWIVPGMGLLGFVIGLVWLSGGEMLSLNLASLAYMKSLSLQTWLATVLPLGLLYWLALGAAWQEQ